MRLVIHNWRPEFWDIEGIYWLFSRDWLIGIILHLLITSVPWISTQKRKSYLRQIAVIIAFNEVLNRMNLLLNHYKLMMIRLLWGSSQFRFPYLRDRLYSVNVFFEYRQDKANLCQVCRRCTG